MPVAPARTRFPSQQYTKECNLRNAFFSQSFNRLKGQSFYLLLGGTADGTGCPAGAKARLSQLSGAGCRAAGVVAWAGGGAGVAGVTVRSSRSSGPVLQHLRRRLQRRAVRLEDCVVPQPPRAAAGRWHPPAWEGVCGTHA